METVQSGADPKPAYRTRIKKQKTLDRGKASFAKALFFGEVLSERLLPYPDTSAEERAALEMTSEAIQRMGREIDLARIEREQRIPEEVLEKLRQMGLFGLIVPEEYGGLGLSNSGYVQMFSELSMIDGSICTLVGAHQSIGLKALLLYGTEEQKRLYLPRLASGEWIAAFGLTEPGAGSDAGSIRTKGQLSEDGKAYLLSGNKIWISNGGIAHFFTIFARTEEGITAFIVTRDMPGFSSGPDEKKLGLKGSSTTALFLDQVRVPKENILGQPGNGFKIAMAVLNNGRLGLAGACALGPRKLIQMARGHATARQQFGQPLSEFGLIQSKFAQMAMETYVSESLVRMTTRLLDRGDTDYGVESAICKVFNTEVEWRIVNECLQIAGGSGYMVEYGYEKILRDSRIFTIWEGTNEVLRLFIGLSGIQGPGEQLKEVSRALRQPMKDVLDSMGVLGDFGARWLQRRVGPAESLVGIHSCLSRETGVFETYVSRLAEASELALRKHGKNIIHNQFAVRRLADTAIDLYALACALARASQAVAREGTDKSQKDILLVRLFCRKARRRMAENLRRMTKNEDDWERSIANKLYEEGLPQHALFL